MLTRIAYHGLECCLQEMNIQDEDVGMDVIMQRLTQTSHVEQSCCNQITINTTTGLEVRSNCEFNPSQYAPYFQ